MERDQIALRVDELRAEHPGREEFIAAVQEFGQELDLVPLHQAPF